MTAVQPPVLLVEGKTDEYLIVQLLMQHGIFAHGAHGKTLSAASRAKVEVIVEYLSTDSGGSGSKSELLNDVVARIRRPAHTGRLVMSLMPTIRRIRNGVGAKRGGPFDNRSIKALHWLLRRKRFLPTAIEAHIRVQGRG